MNRSLLFTLFALAAPAAACGGDDTAEPFAPLPPESCHIAVVASDYRSTAVSLLTADGALCRPDIITSGSRPPGLLAALSGDVALPSEPDPSARVHLIDRYPNAVVTTVDPATDEVLAQRAVSPGYAGNPQDLAFVAGAPLVSLLERPSPRDRAAAPIDLLHLTDPPATIDLSTHADPGLDPMPTRFARAAGRLWIGLGHLAADFSRAGPGRALALDPATLAVTHTLDLAPFENCGNIAAASPTAGLWVVCSGLFRDADDASRLTRAGLAWRAPDLDPAQPDLAPSWTLAAADLHAHGHAGRPLGFTLAPLDDDRALVVSLGDLAGALPDRLLLVSRADARVTLVAEARPFELGAVLPLPAAELVLVADADPRDPRIRRFTWPDADGATTELSPVSTSPSGLPPRHLARFR